MGIEPKDILLLIIGWVVTKLLDKIVKLANEALSNEQQKKKPKSKSSKQKSSKRKRRK